MNKNKAFPCRLTSSLESQMVFLWTWVGCLVVCLVTYVQRRHGLLILNSSMFLQCFSVSSEVVLVFSTVPARTMANNTMEGITFSDC